jgi:murein DD-endopeptidase MepM/ murein hydrolase activator NlpD
VRGPEPRGRIGLAPALVIGALSCAGVDQDPLGYQPLPTAARPADPPPSALIPGAGSAPASGPLPAPSASASAGPKPADGAGAHAAAADSASPWAYVLPVDHGIRRDPGGKGFFLASRAHGKHNGIDLLAPVGTPILAACAGSARSGNTGGFGRWVQLVCPVPADLTGDDRLFTSLFYAHLDTVAAPDGAWAAVSRAQPLGTVGKTGNSRSPVIMPHLHLELIAHETEAKALAETHSGRDQANSVGADRLFARLESGCLGASGFTSQGGLRRARRADPFPVLTCLTRDKPPFTIPAPPLDVAAVKWSEHYAAATFDVNAGRGAPPPAARASGISSSTKTTEENRQ